MRRLGLLLLLGLIALSGCGGSSSPSTSSEAGFTSSSAKQAEPRQAAEPKRSAGEAKEPGPPASAFHPKPHHDSGGGSSQFIQKGADNSIQEYGQEASEPELQEAAESLHGFLDARAERNWAAACGYLSKDVVDSFEHIAEMARKATEAKQLPAGTIKGKGCAAALDALSSRLPTSNLHEAAIANVGALRVKGDQAFLIYRGAQGVVAAIQVIREAGAWKVGALNGIPLN